MALNNLEITVLFFLSVIIILLVPYLLRKSRKMVGIIPKAIGFITLAPAFYFVAHASKPVLIMFHQAVGTNTVINTVTGALLISLGLYAGIWPLLRKWSWLRKKAAPQPELPTS
jgi:hypothetical protein